jgi:putative transposase
MAGRPPRLADSLYIGVRTYSLTICCDERRIVLTEQAARDIVLTELRRTSCSYRIAVLTYCLMPDHIHLVARGEARDSDCLAFMRIFKQTTAFRWKQQSGQRLWQRSFYDHVLRDGEDAKDVVKYVLANPVRAKLVASPKDYPHSGSFVYERTELIEWAFGSEDGGV